MGNYMGTSEAAEKWGYNKATVAGWCRNGKIKGAEQDKPGCPWRIPSDAECPKRNSPSTKKKI